jgi:hypothetical protein
MTQTKFWHNNSIWVYQKPEFDTNFESVEKVWENLLEKVKELGVFIHSTTFLKDKKHQNPSI